MFQLMIKDLAKAAKQTKVRMLDCKHKSNYCAPLLNKGDHIPLLRYSLAKFGECTFQSIYKGRKCSFSRISIRYMCSNATNRDIANLRKKKRIFAILLFSSTFLLAWLLKQKKLSRLKNILEDCVRLPIDKDLFGAKVSFYRYHNFVFPGPIVTSGVLNELPNFEFKSNDIVVASFPKSGTTWVQEVVHMLTHDCQKTDASYEVLETRFPYLEYPYPGIKKIAATPGQRLIKTHLPFSILPPSFNSSGAKLIYCIRNPRDTVVSYWHFMKLLTQTNYKGSLQDFADMFINDTVPYSPYFDHLKSFTEEKNNRNILIVSYEEMKSNPFKIIRDIAEFLQIPVNNLEIEYIARSTSFKSMTENASVNYEHWKDLGFANKEGKFLRKGEVGDWKKYFNEYLVNMFDEWEKENAHKIDFKLIYD